MKNLIVVLSLIITTLIFSNSVQSQPSVCWNSLVLKPSEIVHSNNDYKLIGTIVYFGDVGYFKKLQHDEWDIHYHHYVDSSNTTETTWLDHLTLFLNKDSNLTIYSYQTMITNTAMGLVRCYDVNFAKDWIQKKYPESIQGDIVSDTLIQSRNTPDTFIYAGDKDFPRWEYVEISSGKIIIHYDIVTGNTVVEFINIILPDKQFSLPLTELN